MGHPFTATFSVSEPFRIRFLFAASTTARLMHSPPSEWPTKTKFVYVRPGSPLINPLKGGSLTEAGARSSCGGAGNTRVTRFSMASATSSQSIFKLEYFRKYASADDQPEN